MEEFIKELILTHAGKIDLFLILKILIEIILFMTLYLRIYLKIMLCYCYLVLFVFDKEWKLEMCVTESYLLHISHNYTLT